MQHLIFELTKVALGHQERLSVEPNIEEWISIFKLVRKLEVTGLLYHGIEILTQNGQKPPRDLCFKWFKISDFVRKRNQFLDEKSMELLSMLSHDGIKACILKGQGIARFYPDHLKGLRLCGDIDIYANCERERIDAFAQKLGKNDIAWSYRHVEVKLPDKLVVELHYRMESFFNPFKNKRFQHFILQNEEQIFCHEGNLVTPSLTMYLFYALLHIYNHILSSRIGIKQVIDYYFLLKAANGQFGRFAQGESLIDVLRGYKMMRFAAGMMWILQEVAGLEREYMLCDPCEKEGRFLLDRIIMPDAEEKISDSHKKVKDTNVLSFLLKRSVQVLCHYPSDAIWIPMWFFWQRNMKLILSKK